MAGVQGVQKVKAGLTEQCTNTPTVTSFCFLTAHPMRTAHTIVPHVPSQTVFSVTVTTQTLKPVFLK